MTLALYATIWAALVLLAAGEGALAIGRSRRAAGMLHLAGAALSVVHIAIAMSVVHGWSQAAAVRATAAQAERVFGLDWGGGVWANYAFVAIWFAYGWRLGRTALGIAPDWWTWLFRAFVLVMVANGAIVFAAVWRRAIGAVIVAALIWAWWPQSRGSR